MEFRNHGPIDWADVDQATFRYRYPWASVQGSLSRAAGERAVIHIHRRGRRLLRLAQGQLFQIKPTRQPISYHRFGGFLREQAIAAGMKVKAVPGKKGAWTASRGT